jgi:hypothetical protein
MGSLWRLDTETARARLRATLRTYPQHSVAPAALVAVTRYERAEFRLAGTRRLQDALLALGVLCGVAALACAVALARSRAATPARSGR